MMNLIKIKVALLLLIKDNLVLNAVKKFNYLQIEAKF